MGNLSILPLNILNHYIFCMQYANENVQKTNLYGILKYSFPLEI